MIDVSIIIPVKSSEDPMLKDCIASLKELIIDESMEIIVAEGGTIAQARNKGIQFAKGEMIAFIDSDCRAPKNWLQIMKKHLVLLKDAGGIGGTNISPPNSGLLSEAIDEVFESYLGSLGSASLYRPKEKKVVKSIACINSLYWRQALIDAGGFDERFILNEDTNLSARVRAEGYKLYFVPDSFVWHNRRDSIRRFAKQFFSYGVARIRSIFTSINYAEPRFIAPFFGCIIFPFILYFFPFIALIIIGSYLFAIFFTGLKAGYETKRAVFFFLVPLLFIIQHFSYFLGMITGITKGEWEKISKGEVSIHTLVVAK